MAYTFQAGDRVVSRSWIRGSERRLRRGTVRRTEGVRDVKGEDWLTALVIEWDDGERSRHPPTEVRKLDLMEQIGELSVDLVGRIGELDRKPKPGKKKRDL